MARIVYTSSIMCSVPLLIRGSKSCLDLTILTIKLIYDDTAQLLD